MRFIIFNDGYHDDFIVSDNGLAYTMPDFLKMLATPHTQPHQIAELRWEDLECEEEKFSPKTRSLIEKMFVNEGISPFSPEDYDLMWDVADKY